MCIRDSFQEGCQAEQKLFVECLFSEQSKSLIHVFFSEREVSKIPGIPKETAIIPIKSAAVVGAGTMGGGIAMVLANAGMPVLLKEMDQAALDRGLATIKSNYATSVKRGRFSQEAADERFNRITPTPVSYTHLDVYKRQAKGRPMNGYDHRLAAVFNFQEQGK